MSEHRRKTSAVNHGGLACLVMVLVLTPASGLAAELSGRQPCPKACGSDEVCLAGQCISGTIDVAAGGDFSCAVSSYGDVDCWGAADRGQLGRPAEPQGDARPRYVRRGWGAVEIVAGQAFACVRRRAGDVICWGDSDASDPTPITGVRQLAAGADHLCALKVDGTVVCRGRNDRGQLGSQPGPARSSAEPVAQVTDAVHIAAGGAFSCAVKSDGRIACWGSPGGADDRQASLAPALVGGIQDAIQVAVGGGGRSCALRSRGKVVCWGRGQAAADVAGIDDALQVVAGPDYACALRRSNSVTCWGAAPGAGVGKPLVGDPYPDLLEAPVWDVLRISAGPSHVCAIRAVGRASGDVSCWGSVNHDGRLGTGAWMSKVLTPLSLPLPLEPAQLVAHGPRLCARFESGAIRCWSGPRRLEPPPPAADWPTGKTLEVAVGDGHTCVRTEGGAVVCWGANEHGQVGAPLSSQSQGPTKVAGLVEPVAIVAGHAHTCAVEKAGTVACWGKLTEGTGTATPTRVPGLDQPRKLAAGDGATCALTKAGEVACWGPAIGQRVVRHVRPVRVPEVTGAADVALAMNAVCAVLRPGRVECWKLLALPDAKPEPVEGLSDASTIFGGHGRGCAIRREGSVTCWGDLDLGIRWSWLERLLERDGGRFRSTAGTSWRVLADVEDVGGAHSVGVTDEAICALTSTRQVMQCWGGAIPESTPAAGVAVSALSLPMGRDLADRRAPPRDAREAELAGATVLETGIYEIPRREGAVPVLVRATTVIPLELGVRFGFRYQTRGSAPGKPVGLNMRLIPPAAVRQRGVSPFHWANQYSESLGTYVGKTELATIALNSKSLLVPGRWSIQILLGSQLLAEKEFRLVAR